MTAAATPSRTLPDRIRARIHNKALSRIPRMFDAGCDTILAELLQNARRSGTDHVFVTYRQDTDYPEYGVISIEDNGFGIAQPEIILLYGANAWQDAVTEREDAAGVNGTERCPVFGKIRCPIFCTLKDSNPGGYPEAALPSSSFTATLSIPALRLVLSR